jgi:hypothetical protein
MTSSLLITADDLLRGRVDDEATGASSPSPAQLILMIVCFGMVYGAAMGCSNGMRGERAWQVIYSAVKVPILLGVTFVISLPSFFVLNTLMGVRGQMRQVLRALLAAQGVLTIVLASLAPLTLVFYASTRDYDAWLLFNAMIFAIASFSAQRFLKRQYRELIVGNPIHRRLLYVWLVIFAFVGIQMGWVLRPFVGQPNKPVQFFRHGAWGNAYVEVAQIVWRFLRHVH